jgi:O-antigen/teichoic acid export membrane protein
VSAPIEATRSRALTDVLVQIVTRVANLALGTVVTVLLVRALGAAGFGEWMTIFSVLGLLGYFTSFGLSAVAVREAAADPENADDWIGALVMVEVIMCVPVVLVGTIVLAVVSVGSTMFVAGLVLLAQTPIAIGGSLQIVHQLRMDNRVPMALLTVNSVLWGASVAVIGLLDGGLLALAVAMTATVAVTSVLQAVFAWRVHRFRLRPSRAAMVRLVRVGAPLGIAGLLVMAYGKIDQVIVFGQAGDVAAGQYGAAYRLLEQANFVPVAVLTTLAPMMAALWPSDRARLLRITTMAAELLAIASFGALAFALVAGAPLMGTLFGAELQDGARVLPVLTGAFVLICFGYLIDNALLVIGLAHKQMWIALVGLVVNLAGNFALVPKYGFVAAGWMTLATEAVVSGVGLWIALRAIGRPWPRLGRVPLVALASAILALALWAVREATDDALLPLVAVSLVAYPVLLLALRAVSIGEVREILSSRKAATA